MVCSVLFPPFRTSHAYESVKLTACACRKKEILLKFLTSRLERGYAISDSKRDKLRGSSKHSATVVSAAPGVD